MLSHTRTHARTHAHTHTQTHTHQSNTGKWRASESCWTPDRQCIATVVETDCYRGRRLDPWGGGWVNALRESRLEEEEGRGGWGDEVLCNTRLKESESRAAAGEIMRREARWRERERETQRGWGGARERFEQERRPSRRCTADKSGSGVKTGTHKTTAWRCGDDAGREAGRVAGE
jgi:hypothetical protein